jgi:GNAT superfamily N-acetyltransferase
VQAFGSEPDQRRTGIGTALQQHAIEHARAAGCWQMRSRSPVTSSENYALKLAAGYVLTPSEENDSYYFLLRL